MKAYQYIRMEIYGAGTSGPLSPPAVVSMNKILMGTDANETLSVANSILNGVIGTITGTYRGLGGTGLAGLTDGAAISSGNYYQWGTPTTNGVTPPISRNNPVSIRWNLAAPVVLQKVQIYATTNFSSYVPMNFAILGSNDGTNWETIVYFNQFIVLNDPAAWHIKNFNNEIKGEVKAATGTVRVQLFSVVNGIYTHVATAIPATDGTWQCAVENVNPHMILYEPTEQGIRPMADGLIAPTPYV